MFRDYQIVSPSLEGVLSHSSIEYKGLKRPTEVLRVLDGPSSKGNARNASDENKKVLENYFLDLYSIFMKKLSYFVVETEPSDQSTLTLQAMLQEMIKIKKLMI